MNLFQRCGTYDWSHHRTKRKRRRRKIKWKEERNEDARCSIDEEGKRREKASMDWERSHGGAVKERKKRKQREKNDRRNVSKAPILFLTSHRCLRLRVRYCYNCARTLSHHHHHRYALALLIYFSQTIWHTHTHRYMCHNHTKLTHLAPRRSFFFIACDLIIIKPVSPHSQCWRFKQQQLLKQM